MIRHIINLALIFIFIAFLTLIFCLKYSRNKKIEEHQLFDKAKQVSDSWKIKIKHLIYDPDDNKKIDKNCDVIKKQTEGEEHQALQNSSILNKIANASENMVKCVDNEIKSKINTSKEAVKKVEAFQSDVKDLLNKARSLIN